MFISKNMEIFQNIDLEENSDLFTDIPKEDVHTYFESPWINKIGAGILILWALYELITYKNPLEKS